MPEYMYISHADGATHRAYRDHADAHRLLDDPEGRGRVFEIKIPAVLEDHLDVLASKKNLAGEVLRIASLCGTEPIPLWFIHRCIVVKRGYVGEMLRLWWQDQQHTHRATADLVEAARVLDQWSIVQFNETDDPIKTGAIVMDHEMQAAVRYAAGKKAINKTLKSLGRVYETLFVLLLNSDQSDMSLEILPHALFWFSYKDDRSGAIRLLIRIVHHLWYYQYYDQAAVALERLIELYRSLGESSWLELACSIEYLSQLNCLIEEYDKAQSLLKESLAIYQKMRGDNHPDIVRNFMNLGNIQTHLEQYEAAASSYQQAVDCHHRIPQHDDLVLARLYECLGFARTMLKEYDKANALLRNALALYKQHHQDADIARCLHNLAYSLQQQEKYEESVPLYQQSLEFCQQLYPENRHLVAHTLGNLALAKAKLGDTDEAELMAAASLAMYEQMYENDHSDIGRGLHNLADVYVAQGRFEEALVLNRRAVETGRRCMPEDHPYLTCWQEVACSPNPDPHTMRVPNGPGRAEETLDETDKAYP